MTAGFVVLLPLILALLAAPAAVAAGALRSAYAAPVGSAFAALAAVAVLWGWLSGGGVVDVAWVPSWEVRFAVALDGLAALYALLATGIGFAVLVYSSRYLPLHLEHQGRPESDATGFYFFVLLFMGSMVGLAMAQDLVLLFVFWDLTAIASYYLIGYDRHKKESRASALMALARHRGDGGAAPDRGAPPLRRLRDVLRSRARREGRAGTAAHGLGAHAGRDGGWRRARRCRFTSGCRGRWRPRRRSRPTSTRRRWSPRGCS